MQFNPCCLLSSHFNKVGGLASVSEPNHLLGKQYHILGFLIFFSLFIRVSLLYNVMSFSAIQQSESAIRMSNFDLHMFNFSQIRIFCLTNDIDFLYKEEI